MPQTRFWQSGLLLAASIGAGAAAGVLPATDADAQMIPVRVTAQNHDYAEVPVSVVIAADQMTKKRSVPKDAVPTAYQTEPAGPGMVRLTWIVRDLKKGQSRVYALTPAASSGSSRVEIREDGANRDILVNGKLFTRYDTTTTKKKPFLYPLIGPGGKQVVRHWPMQEVEGETRDHPHHKGMWFTHGEMNGVDFWADSDKSGSTVHTGYEAAHGGPFYGHLRTKTDWIAPDGKKLAEDVRDITIYNVSNGSLMDFTIAVKAVGGPLTWGDTKEGTFAIRVADTMRPDLGRGKKGEGVIENSEGLTQDATWGKSARWVDYVGPVEGETLGIAVFDHPENLRHPTTWHVRTYGLFAVNPFGLHDFDPALKDKADAGNHVTPEGQTTTFRYRIFIHRGTTKDARIPEVYAAYANPPRSEVL